MSSYLTLDQEVQSVLEFLSRINASLVQHRGRVEGEVTSVKNTYQTAIYFSIKDLKQDALLNCVIWRSTYNQNGVAIKEGDKVIITGIPEIYAARGSFSMKVQTIEYAGEGALKKAYDELRAKLTAEGLLSLDRKRVLPLYPKKIGVITSRSGVVIQDFNANLGRYGFAISMVDSRVEGKDAIHELLAALKTLSKQDIEVLVIMRGGGSWESLQAFNTESVVRAIAGFKCPVVTGIGHDVDVTLAELVADVGASTPTAVAEALNVTWDTLLSTLVARETQILNSFQRALTNTERMLENRQSILLRRFDQIITSVTQVLNDRKHSLQQSYRQIDKQITEAHTAAQKVMMLMKSHLKTTRAAYLSAEMALPKKFRSCVRSSQVRLQNISANLAVQQGRGIRVVLDAVMDLEQKIKIHDPARNLKLGYSLTYQSGKLVRSVKELTVGEMTEVRVSDGSFTSEIKKVI